MRNRGLPQNPRSSKKPSPRPLAGARDPTFEFGGVRARAPRTLRNAQRNSRIAAILQSQRPYKLKKAGNVMDASRIDIPHGCGTGVNAIARPADALFDARQKACNSSLSRTQIFFGSMLVKKRGRVHRPLLLMSPDGQKGGVNMRRRPGRAGRGGQGVARCAAQSLNHAFSGSAGSVLTPAGTTLTYARSRAIAAESRRVSRSVKGRLVRNTPAVPSAVARSPT